MRNKKGALGLFLLCLLTFTFLFPINGLCYGTGPSGHEGLAEKSIQLKKTLTPNLKDELQGDNEETVRKATSAEDAIFSDEIFPRWMKHFYNPVTGKGLPYFENAKERAERFYKSAVDSYCDRNKPKAWDKLGHAMHLLQDMGAPPHVRNAAHAFLLNPNWGFENYVSNNWMTLESQIVAEDCELAGGMGRYIDAMSSYTYLNYRKYDREYIKWVGDPPIPILVPVPVTTGEDPYPDEPFNTVALLNKVVCYSAGLINSFWNDVQACSQKPPLPGPGGDHPDDNYEVSIPLAYDIDEAEYQWLNMRLAMKKGRIGYYWAYLYGSKYQEIYNLHFAS